MDTAVYADGRVAPNPNPKKNQLKQKLDLMSFESREQLAATERVHREVEVRAQAAVKAAATLAAPRLRQLWLERQWQRCVERLLRGTASPRRRLRQLRRRLRQRPQRRPPVEDQSFLWTRADNGEAVRTPRRGLYHGVVGSGLT